MCIEITKDWHRTKKTIYGLKIVQAPKYGSKYTSGYKLINRKSQSRHSPLYDVGTIKTYEIGHKYQDYKGEGFYCYYSEIPINKLYDVNSYFIIALEVRIPKNSLIRLGIDCFGVPSMTARRITVLREFGASPKELSYFLKIS